jgi:hypothetical protein
MAQQAGQNALGLNYNPQQYGNAYQGINPYNPGTFNQQNVAGTQANAAQLSNAPTAQSAQFQGPNAIGYQGVNSQQFTGNQVGQYMNPYLQQALAPQMAELNRAYDITGNQAKAQSVGAGAFGGSRQALMSAENDRNRNMGIANLLGQGYNTAYNQAANQFNTSNQQNLQAQLANQGAGLTAGQFNATNAYNTAAQNAQLQQQANLANQQMMGQYGLTGAGYQQAANLQNAQLGQQANLANQQTNLATQQAQQAANQFGYGQQAANAQNLAQYGQASNALNAQQQQFGAGLGLQGQQTALQAAGALGNLGATQFGQQAQGLGIQGQMGGVQQQQQQNVLNQQYQDFLNQKQYPYQQTAFMSDMLRGLPLSQSTTSMYSNPSTLSQVAGLGLTGAAVGNAFPTLFKARGGAIQERPAGLAELAIHQMA